MTRDVAEMLVAADSLRTSTGELATELENALRTMDDVQRYVADLYDTSYDDYLDLYPAWRMYILSKNPAQQQVLFDDYKTLLDRFEERRSQMIKHIGVLVAFQKALLPHNTYVDPYGRIEPSEDIEGVLDDFWSLTAARRDARTARFRSESPHARTETTVQASMSHSWFQYHTSVYTEFSLPSACLIHCLIICITGIVCVFKTFVFVFNYMNVLWNH